MLLLIDGHKSHLTLNLCRLCEANQIILYALLPNATHIIQPLDVAVFRAVKSGWMKEVEDWKVKSKNRTLTRATFPLLFETVINEKATPKIVQNGFRKCGIYPFNLDNINYKKCMNDPSRSAGGPTSSKTEMSAKPAEFLIPHLLYVESCLSGNRAEEFRAKESIGWDGDESAKELFEVWKRLRRNCMEGANKAVEEDSAEDPTAGPDDDDPAANPDPDILPESDEAIIVEINEDQMAEVLLPVTEQPVVEEINVAPADNQSTENEIEIKIVVTLVKIPECKSKHISPAFLGHIVWPTESPGKKNRPPGKNSAGEKKKEKLPHATGRKQMAYWEDVDEKKIQK